MEVGGAKEGDLALDGAEAHSSCGLIPEDAACGGCRGRGDHSSLIAKEGKQGRGRDLNVVRFHEGAGYIAPRI